MNREQIDLIAYMNPGLLDGADKELKIKIQSYIYAQQFITLANKDQLYLYYEIRSIKSDQMKTLQTLKKLQELGVNSLDLLQEMETTDYILCDLQELSQEKKILLSPQLQYLIYEKMMNDNIDDTIMKLKQYKILTLEQFFSEDEKLLLSKLSVPKYQYRQCKKDYMINQPNFKPLDKILKDEEIQRQTPLEQKLTDGQRIQSLSFQMNQYNNQPNSQQFIRQVNGFKIIQYPILQKNQINNLQDYKTIVFIGQIEAGKTTLMNFFLNFYLDVKFEDDFRYQMAEAEETKGIYTYYIQPQNQKYGLRIVDTQGIGLTQDTAITQKISDYLIKEIDQITAVCYVYKSTTTRLDSTEIFTLDYIMQTFGLRFAKNSVFALTFCDAANPQATITLQTKGDGQNKASPVSGLIPQIPWPWYQKFNSSILIAHNKEDYENQVEEQDVDMNKQQWEAAMKNFQEFYDKKLHSSSNISFEKPTNSSILLSWLNQKKNLYTLFNKLSLIKSDFYQLNSRNNYIYQFREYSFQKGINTINSNVGISVFCKICKFVCLYQPSQKDSLETILKQYDTQNNYGTCLCGCLLTSHQQESNILEIIEKEKIYRSKSLKASQDWLCNNYVDVLLLCYKIQNILMQLNKQLKFNLEGQAEIYNFETFLDYLINTEKTQINDGTKKNLLDVLELRKQDWRWLCNYQCPLQQKKEILSSSLYTKWINEN